MKLAATVFLMLFPSAIFAQSLICTPVTGCFLPEGKCEPATGVNPDAIVDILEGSITISPIGGEPITLEIIGSSMTENMSSYFGVESNNHFMMTFYKNGSAYVLGAYFEGDDTVGIGQLNCQPLAGGES